MCGTTGYLVFFCLEIGAAVTAVVEIKQYFADVLVYEVSVRNAQPAKNRFATSSLRNRTCLSRSSTQSHTDCSHAASAFCGIFLDSESA